MYKVLIISVILFVNFLFSVELGNKMELEEKTIHPIHLSFTNIEYIESEKEFKILFKLFVDDFDKIIYNKYRFVLDFQHDKKVKGFKEVINKYFAEHIVLKINDNKINSSRMIYKSHIIKDDGPTVWLYYKINYRKEIEKVEIKNSLMTDLYPDQKNLLIFNYKEFQRAVKFDNNNTLELIELK